MGQAMENLDILLDYGRDFQGVTDSGNFKMWGPLMIYGKKVPSSHRPARTDA